MQNIVDKVKTYAKQVTVTIIIFQQNYHLVMLKEQCCYDLQNTIETEHRQDSVAVHQLRS